MDHDLDRWHRRAREKRANPLIYGFVRVTFQAFFWVYFRMRRIGLEHVPRRGPVIIAANHRSFLDPFVIACMARRPMYYVAKQEIFKFRVLAWLLSSLGAFPVRRGAGDADMITTAKAILARGDIVLIFPEGTRTRPGALGRPRRGVGRLALETGVPVVPVAVIGTEAIRRGWRIRPHRVRLRAGPPLRFPQVDHPSKQLAAAVTDRIWPCVMLQWEWLGGLAPVRRVAVIGAGQWGTAMAVCLARAGMEVDLGCRTAEQATVLQETRVNSRYLPDVTLPDAVRVMRASELILERIDLVCLAVPARALPAVLAAYGGQITGDTGVVVVSKGLVSPLGTLPAAFAAERSGARATAVLGGPAHATEMLEHGASVVVASLDRGFSRQLSEVLTAAGLDISTTTDVTGVELAGCAKNAAVLAAAAASGAGAGVAGAAAGKVFAEVDALARARGGRPETFAGLAGAGDLVASVVSSDSSHRRAGELLAEGVSVAEISRALGQGAEAVESVPLLATAAREARLDAPALDGLAALLDGRIEPEQWAAAVTQPPGSKRSGAIRAA
ncbi:MAG TPA: 1-acyl-sn-glycerol-3-phosphate acyltransferase [Solirubrobacteraceae bacterium]|nr:1-acyl-sn-glycerol-3-phosphate acyltransferase [Solirubrobacteraceae bacterium]